MPVYFQKPENALKRAHEFLDVKKDDRALEVLYDVLKSKKHRAWQKVHEAIIVQYLELCVKLQKSHTAKEGLYQYKNICQSVNVKSLEEVVRKYLSMATERTELAREKSKNAVVDVEDLDVIQTPEDLLLSAVTSEDSQDRTDRAILTPWVKFLWESYRQCLELLRNNSTVERLYQDIAQNAFKFCLQYQRKTEFRKLCDNLRMHLGHVHKYQHQPRAIDLSNPDSQSMHLETRLVQLDSAIQIELWQEAFKAVEDIHGLISLSKKQPKPSLMAIYYQKLCLVFLKSGNNLFHACSWHKLFLLSKEQKKNISSEELSKLASNVLCSTLAVPLAPARSEIFSQSDNNVDKKRRLSTLLDMPTVPNRQSLVKDLVKHNVLQHILPELTKFYQIMECEFQPLKMANKLTPIFEFIQNNDDLALYLPFLHDVAITKVLQQVSQVYQNMEYDHFCKLLPFANRNRIEAQVVNAVKNLGIQVRICHRTMTLSFGTDLILDTSNKFESVQNMPGEYLKSQLSNMAGALDKAVSLLQPKHRENEEMRARIALSYRQTAEENHVHILERWKIIEEHKEELENMNIAKEQYVREIMETRQAKQFEAEKERLKREAEARDKERAKREQNEIAKQAAHERLMQLKSTAFGAKVFANVNEEELASWDSDEILALQVQQLEKEKRETNEKLLVQEKKIDYLERAKRLKELEPLKAEAETVAKQQRTMWDQLEVDRVAQMKIDRENALKTRDRLKRMHADKDAFYAKLSDSRLAVYMEKLSEFEKKFAEERKKRLEARKEKRIQERRIKYEKEKEEAEQRRIEEAKRKAREEEELRKKKEREKEQEEYKQFLEQQNAEKLEKEEKQRAAQEKTPSNWRSRDENGSKSEPWRPGGASTEGGWRSREKTREDSWKPSQERGDDERKRLGMPRDIRLDEPGEDKFKDRRGDDTPWRRSGDTGGGSWRDRDTGGRKDDDRFGGRRDDDRYGSGRRDDRGGYGGNRRDFGRRDDRDRDFGRRDDRDFGRRDDRDSGRRDDRDRDFGRRDDRDRDFGRRDDRDRDFGRRDDRNRDFGRRDEGRSWRRGGDDTPSEKDSWRRGDSGSTRDKPRDDKWRDRGERDGHSSDSHKRPQRDEDGWTTVRH